MEQVVDKVRNFKAGYQIRYGRWRTEPEEPWTVMHHAYTPSGDWIGEPRLAYRLCVLQGIAPEVSPAFPNDGDRICSIGFSEREQKWYGWSHRAIYGFSIGDVVKKGDCTSMSGWTDEWLEEHPEQDVSLPVGFTAGTLEDAKKMAIAFAESVS